jgi:hypothetical protein
LYEPRIAISFCYNLKLTPRKDDSDPQLFAQEVRNCAGSSVMLGLWSAKVRPPSPHLQANI